VLQTPTDDDNRRQRAKQYWPIRRASNKVIGWRRSARRIIGMIVASWTMSTVISVPPLFGLDDHSVESFQSSNQSFSDSQRSTSGELPAEDLPLFENHDPDAFNADQFSYSDFYDVMSSAEVSLIYVYEDDNDTLSSETDCIISQNLGYTVFSTVGAFYLPLA